MQANKTFTIYLNMRTQYGIETIDEFTREPTQSPKDFRAYVRKMIHEYHIAGMNVYKSSHVSKTRHIPA